MPQISAESAIECAIVDSASVPLFGVFRHRFDNTEC